MVRLMLVLAPVMCILSGIAVSSILTTFMRNLDAVAQNKDKGKKMKGDANYPIKNEVGALSLENNLKYRGSNDGKRLKLI